MKTLLLLFSICIKYRRSFTISQNIQERKKNIKTNFFVLCFVTTYWLQNNCILDYTTTQVPVIMEDAHSKTKEEVIKFFGTNEEVGLTPDQIKTLQAKYGPNGKWKWIFLSFPLLSLYYLHLLIRSPSCNTKIVVVGGSIFYCLIFERKK